MHNFTLRNVILVLNSRFVPRTPAGPYIYGVVQHALRVANVLRSAGAEVGFLLYERLEELTSPRLWQRVVLDSYPAVTIGFNFRMEPRSLTEAFRRAAGMVAEGWPAGKDPLLYYQTSVLLPFSPPEYDIAVTHHSPFVDDVVAAIGLPAARQAFDWDHAKADHLAVMHAKGISTVAARGNIYCAEVSPIQEKFLLRQGIPAERVLRLPQPLESAGEPEPLPPALERATDPAGSGLIAFTAVSRLDHFKNIELFVEGCLLALREETIARAVVVGGFPADPERDRLRRLVPPNLRHAVVLEPRISRSALLGTLFPRLAGHSVFVCPSRFDLVPFTVLEAARAGVCAVVPDSDHVGAATYLPREYRFPPSEVGLASLLRKISLDRELLDGFSVTSKQIRDATTDEAVRRSFLNLCDVIRRRTGYTTPFGV